MSAPAIKGEVFIVPIDRIKPNPWNPNEQSDFVFDKERRSIREHGFLDPITVRELGDGDYEIIDGEHRWRASKLEGMTEIRVNSLGQVPDETAQELTMLMNDLKGRRNQDKMSALLKSLSAKVSVDRLYASLPMAKKDIDSLLSQTLSQSGTSSSGTSESDEEKWKNLKYRLPEPVAAQFERQVERFKIALHPGEDPKKVSPVMAMEALTQALAQIPDDQLI